MRPRPCLARSDWRAAALLAILPTAAALAAPPAARADRIQPFEGQCPPGLGRGIRGRAEVCVPNLCIRDADCGEGAACRGFSQCVSERINETSDERVPRERIEVIHGPCAEDGSCAEGRCRTVRRCEPTVATPAWDPTERRWTGVTHPVRPARPPLPVSSCGCAIAARPRLGVTAIAIAAVGLACARKRKTRRDVRTSTNRVGGSRAAR